MRKEFEKRTDFSQLEIDDWFDWAKNEEVKDGVVWFNEPHHFEDVYFYLIKGETCDMLVDTGMGIKQIKPLLDQVRESINPLVVVNTHWHFDHIGGNKEFENAYVPFRSNEVYGIKRGWKNQELSRYFFNQGFWHGLPNNFNPSTFSIEGFQNTKFIKEKFDLGNRVVIPIYTPGHTQGSVTYYDETNKLLFTGDMLYEGPLYAFEEESDPNLYLESLNNLSKLTVKTIHPGHNHSETTSFPSLIHEAMALFQRAKNKEHWDAEGEFAETVEYHHPEINKGRRLKIIVNKSFVT